MKTMTCKQLGGACSKTFSANTFDEIAQMSKLHGKEMFEKGDQAHLEAMNKMMTLMSDEQKMNEWFTARKTEFDNLPHE